MNSNMTTLTSDQKEAETKFFDFLFSDEKEFFLFGSAGSGKSFLVQYLLEHTMPKFYQTAEAVGIEVPRYEIALTATTNKALSSLMSNFPNTDGVDYIDTIYGLFHIRVRENYKTGRTTLTCADPVNPENTIIFIDECSMLPKKALEMIRSFAGNNCRFVFIGDNYQLAPVNEKPIWNKTEEKVTANLQVPVRNAGHKELTDLCSQLRETVETGIFKDIKLIPGVIDHADDSMAMSFVDHMAQDDSAASDIVLCYTNAKAMQYIELIDQKKGESDYLREGQVYINNRFFSFEENKKATSFFVEEHLRIDRIEESEYYGSNDPDEIKIHGRIVKVSSVDCPSKRKKVYAFVPDDPAQANRALSVLAKQKKWMEFFDRQKQILDLRLPYACTVHKAQGSTYRKVFIDLDSFHCCKDKAVLARLLYVACSRAKEQVIFYGSMPHEAGELI